MPILNLTTTHLSIIIAVMTPLFTFGMIKGINLISEKVKVRKGFIKVREITKSSRILTKMLKPKGNKIDLGGRGKKKPVPFDNEPGKIVFEGTTPVVIYTDDGTQLNLKTAKQKSIIDKEYLSLLIMESYNLGILAAQREDKQEKLLMFAVLLISAASAVLSYLAYQAIGSLG